MKRSLWLLHFLLMRVSFAWLSNQTQKIRTSKQIEQLK